MKSLLLDPRIKLFCPKTEGLEDVEPLFHPEDFVYYDRFLDGDPFENEHYIRIFQKILNAIKNHRSVRLLYHLKMVQISGLPVHLFGWNILSVMINSGLFLWKEQKQES